MHLQSIFQVGNSHVVAIPRHLMSELGFKKGQKVIVEKAADSTGVSIYPQPKMQPEKASMTKEFTQWLDSFLAEDKDLLEELAKR